MKRYAPPPADLDPPPEAKVAVIHYYDLNGRTVDEPVSGGLVEIVFWGDEEETNMVGSAHGTAA